MYDIEWEVLICFKWSDVTGVMSVWHTQKLHQGLGIH